MAKKKANPRPHEPSPARPDVDPSPNTPSPDLVRSSQATPRASKPARADGAGSLGPASRSLQPKDASDKNAPNQDPAQKKPASKGPPHKESSRKESSNNQLSRKESSHNEPPRKKRKGAPTGRHSSDVRMRPTPLGWEIIHPRCALERSEDMEEVRQMLEGGEAEIAEDEVRWLLGGCADFLDAHAFLGELALEREDYKLARGHYGRVLMIVEKAWDRAGAEGRLPASIPSNRVVHEAGKALILCLGKLEKKSALRSAARQLLAWDASDPLAVRALCETFGVKLA